MSPKLRQIAVSAWRSVARFVRRRPRTAFGLGVIAPWLFYALSSGEHGSWAASGETGVVAVVLVALVAQLIKNGVSRGRWTRVACSYALGVNLLIAEFAYLHYSLAVASLDAFTEPLSKIDAAYFAWATMTTTGFGDIAPRSVAARLAVTVEMACTLVVLSVGIAIVLARLPSRSRE